MKDLNRVRKNVERMMRKFPSRTATVYRPVYDEYGQPTEERTEVGAVECWTEGIQRPNKHDITNAGERFEDEGARWVALIADQNLIEARHGDVIEFSDGETGVIQNVMNRVGVRAFWQIINRDEG